LGKFIKLVALQPALACPPPSTVADTHFTLTAEAGTAVHPSKLGDVVPAFNVHISPFLPCSTFQETVATVLPATFPPGLFAVNEIVLGVARRMPTQQNPVLGSVGFPDGITGVGWRGLEIGF
jgi:hypothetical protein